MGRVVDPTLEVRRDLRGLRRQLRVFAAEKIRKRLRERDPALCEQLAASAEDAALRLRARHRFLLGKLGPPLLDSIELMLLARRLRGQSEDYADELALALLDHRHVRLPERLEARLAEMVEQVIAQEAR